MKYSGAKESHVPVIREKERAEDLPEHFVGVVEPYFIERYRQSGEKESGSTYGYPPPLHLISHRIPADTPKYL